MKDLLFLLNPKSKSGNATRIWENACRKYSILPKNPIDITKINITTLLKKEQPKIVIIAGGDGTINSVCSEVSNMQNKPLLSIIPLGLGNALSYCLGVENLDKAVSVISNPDKKITIDLMKTNIPNHERGVFSISAGFSARVVFQRQAYKYIGFGSYIISGIQSIFSHPDNEITFTIDKNVTITALASSLIIANSPVIGLNYVVAPNARLNDGFLDCTLISTKYADITNMRLKGFKHPLYSEIGKARFKAKHISIEGEPFVQIDGDPARQKGIIEVEIIPSQVTFLRNSDKNIDQEYLPFVK
ncbi:MAG TPA: diacylglycerol kinase family protein [Candidatus Limnocylindrales bacterium]|nr:diacylglycerol kinase family protein [Candidatus Limnocylindrales bacterium]